MTQMIQRAEHVTRFDVDEALDSDDGGRRLAAYAFLYAHPDFVAFEHLVRAVTRPEPQPFAQYWGLQSIRRMVARLPQHRSAVDMAKGELKKLYDALGPGVDRTVLVEQILREMEDRVKRPPPYRFSPSDRTAQTLGDFLDECRAGPTLAAQQLQRGYFEPWLRDSGWPALADAAEQIRQAGRVPKLAWSSSCGRPRRPRIAHPKRSWNSWIAGIEKPA